MKLLGRIITGVPYGVVFVCDFDGARTPPIWADETQLVAGDQKGIAVKVLHEQVGLTDISVSTGHGAAMTRCATKVS